jgi:para-aminobenzoate synthetase/4-amino-4-deoxychorismate lyase
VHVPDLFTVETFETVLQMTSGVEGMLPPERDFSDIVRALFPPGSVTGAPKVRAVEIITELEDGPRGVYTGAIGYLKPYRGCLFNVAIRTLHLSGGRGEIGIGSGIVQDSRSRLEYEECLLKLKFLTEPPAEDFELIETLRFDWSSGFVLLRQHLDRLEQSALRLGFPLSRRKISDALYEHAARLSGPSHRVRLTLSKMGEIAITSTPLPRPSGNEMTFAIAPDRIDPNNLFLYHKTTNRRFYDETRRNLNAATGCDEVVFLNIYGELTEGSFTNLFLEINGEILTPALSCGLLPGTLRQDLIERGQAREAILTLDDLSRASAIWLGTSVRGLLRAKLVGSFAPQGSVAT